MELGEDEEKINLIIVNGTTFVWTSEDWLRLRSLRILGNFVGSLAALPRQDQVAGFPLALLREETTLLLEKGFAVLRNLPSLAEPPNHDIREKSDEHRGQLLSQQVELMKDKRKKEIESKIDVILKGKKAKRKCSGTGEELNRETVLQEEFDKVQPVKKSSLVIQICTDDPWLKSSDYKECPWNYPETVRENLCYKVFKDLWERGYYITPGGKFGGDYLAYPGDPVKFHAFFIVICVEKRRPFRMNDIISYGRLGQSVRKTVSLAYLDDNETVNYQSLQWAGF